MGCIFSFRSAWHLHSIVQQSPAAPRVLQYLIPRDGVRDTVEIITHDSPTPLRESRALSYLYRSGGGKRDLGIHGRCVYI